MSAKPKTPQPIDPETGLPVKRPNGRPRKDFLEKYVNNQPLVMADREHKAKIKAMRIENMRKAREVREANRLKAMEEVPVQETVMDPESITTERDQLRELRRRRVAYRALPGPPANMTPEESKRWVAERGATLTPEALMVWQKELFLTEGKQRKHASAQILDRFGFKTTDDKDQLPKSPVLILVGNEMKVPPWKKALTVDAQPALESGDDEPTKKGA